MTGPRGRLLLERIYLVYLGLLPLAASAGAIVLFDRPLSGLLPGLALALASVIAVAVYLASTAAYVGFPRTWWAGLLVLFDGPAQLALSVALQDRPTPWHVFVEAFLVDGLPLYLAIGLLALRSPLPSMWQRIGAVLLMLVAIGAALFLLAPPVLRDLAHEPILAVLPLVSALVLSSAINYRLVRTDRVVRDPGMAGPYVGGLALVWVVVVVVVVNGRNAGWF